MSNPLLVNNARILTEKGLVSGSVLCENGVFTAVGNVTAPENAKTVDAAGRILAPAFLDLHTHGAANVDVNEGRVDGILEIARFFAKNGVGGWLCSILTDTEEQTLKCIEAICTAMEHPDGANIMGIHLEGPFLSHHFAGAMPRHLLRDGDLELIKRYQAAAKGNIRSITLAPELPGMLEIIPELSKMMLVCIGHSYATYAEAMAAIDAGAGCITHTFNAMRPFHHHEPGITAAAIESDVYCETIYDGLHLHPATIRMLLKAKGKERLVPVTDSIMATGLPDGFYKLGVNDIVVKDGDARLRDKDVRAGSTLVTTKGLKNLLSFTRLPIADVLLMMTRNPSKLLGIYETRGRIAEGCRADFNLIDDEGNIAETYILANKI